MAITNPSIADRADQTQYFGPDGNGTELTGPLQMPTVVIMAADLPTSDPGVAGQLWSNIGVLTVSAG